MNIPGSLNLWGSNTQKPTSRITVAGLITIGFVMIISMILDKFLIGVAILAVPAILFLLAGSSIRVLAVIFGLQIILTITQLSSAQLYLGFISLRVDDLLTIWLLWLWILSLPDRSMKGIKTGPQGYLISLFVFFIAIAAFRGFTIGNTPDFIGQQIKTFGAYLLYFPLLWVLSDDKSRELVWRVVLTSGIIGGFIFVIKGVFGSGEGVYYRDETGLRIGTRQPNAIGAILLLLTGKLWKSWKTRPPIIFILPSIVFMGGALILSQTRGLWGGIFLALASAWILNLFRKRDNIPLGKRMIVSLTVLAGFVILIVFSISAMGILSAADVAQRTGHESGSYLTDVSVLSRLISWSAVMDRISGSNMLIGRGLGSTITYFKPEIGEVRTLFYVDSSYFQTALVMGITGVVVLLSIFLNALIRAAKLFIRTTDSRRAGTALGIFCALIMLLFASGFASAMTNYRYTIFWMYLLAYLQTEINRENDSIEYIRSELVAPDP